MLILLPFIAWILLFFLSYQTHCWRTSSLLAAITWGTTVVIIVEFLSIINFINIWGISLAWLSVNVILSGLYWKYIYRNRKRLSLQFQLPFYSIVLLIGVALIVAILGTIAFVAPPNNWDSMTYHMARVVHWMQNQNVGHYPTNYLPQLYQSPWSEFTIMNFQILSGGDRFANLVQWFSMVGSLIGVSLISKKLGTKSFGQILSIVFTATLPMGIMQATNTKNDYAVAFWLVCFVYFILDGLESKINTRSCIKIGISLGLALLTKGTAYFYALPFCIWLGVEVLMLDRSRFWQRIIVLSSPLLLINIGHYLRNLDLFGVPIFSPPEYRIEYFSISTLLSNIIKNMALHMPVPFNIIKSTFIENLVTQLHKIALKVDINDPQITSPGVFFDLSKITLNNEDLSPNPFHFYLILLAIILFLICKKLKNKRKIFKYFITLTFALFVFCLLVKWQPWQSRLHLAIFVLFSPFVGTVLEKHLNQRLSVYISVALITLSSFWLFFNLSRPIIATQNIFNTVRTRQYFNHFRLFEEDYFTASQFVKNLNCPHIGLSLKSDDWEYPLWMLLKENSIAPMRIQHINIENVSKVKQAESAYNQFSPCAIIDFGRNSETTLVNESGVYDLQFVGQFLLRHKSPKLLRVYVKRE